MVTTGNKKRGRRFDRGGSRTPRSAALAAKLMAVARDPLTLIRETARARRNQYCLSFALNPLAPVRPSRSWMAFHHNDPLIVPSRRPISIIHTAKARHATGPPNPSADFIIGEVRGHDRRTKGRRSRSSGAAYIILQIARVDFDFPAAHSGDGTRDNNCGLVSSGGMEGPCRSVLDGGGGRMRDVPKTESSLDSLFGAPLLAASFLSRAVHDTNAPPD
jgi:hypothetical protein